jgi:hypothetical protein
MHKESDHQSGWHCSEKKLKHKVAANVLRNSGMNMSTQMNGIMKISRG